MRWFRYRRGEARESLQAVVHCVESIDSDGTVRSWCWLTLQPAQIEEVNDPTSTPVVAQHPPCEACERCLEASRDAVRDRRDPAAIQTDASLATILRKAQWLLDDAAFHLPEGRCSSEDCELLATTLDQLAALVRERGARRVTIDSPTE